MAFPCHRWLIICPDPLPEAKLCGADIASVSLDLLYTLHISTMEDRERLLSAIYTELHPPTRLTQRLDALLGTGSLTNTDRQPLKHSSVSPMFPQNPRLPVMLRLSQQLWRQWTSRNRLLTWAAWAWVGVLSSSGAHCQNCPSSIMISII